MDKLPEKITEKLAEVVELWADEYLPGRPALLAQAMYFSLKKKMLEKTNEIEEKFLRREADG